MTILCAMTGASGTIYGATLLDMLRDVNITTHLIMSNAAEVTAKYEYNGSVKDIQQKADKVFPCNDIGASCASGTQKYDAMIIAPCSMGTLGRVANGTSDNLIIRAADVQLKQRRPCFFMVRETPFNLIHINNMKTVTEAGGIIAPPLPALYQKPQTIDDMVRDTIAHILDMLDIAHPAIKRWRNSTK